MQQFGSLLARALAARGLSQKQFAALVGVHASMVNKVILGRRPPNWKHSADWAQALGLTSAEAMAFEDAMHLAAASPRVRRIVHRLELAARRGRPS